jgi:protein involved in polysaccharide export with SLBB domain
MTLADALILAKGFKMEAASNRIEIARIANFDKAIAQSVPTQMTILSFSISKNIGSDVIANTTKLQPYDQIYVRVTPEFEYQQKIHIGGEVLYPGDYVITTKDEKLASLIDRAGGLSRYAYPKGARLYRKEDGIGDVLLDLDKALKKKNSKYNYILRKDDSIFIPAIKDLVVLQGEFGYPNVNKPENLYVPYSAGKNARYYIKTYGAGYSPVASKRKIYVIQPNGMVQKKNPPIEKGSTIVIPEKVKKPQKEPRVRNPNGSDNLYKVLNATVGSITSVLTMYLLIQTILKN